MRLFSRWMARQGLNGIYLLLMLAASPRLMWSALFENKYRQGWREKLWGQVPSLATEANAGPTVWLHAVSVGEVNLIAPLVKALQQDVPELRLAISTTTQTGFNLAQRRYPDHCVFFAPLDFSWAVGRAMRRVQPDLLVLAELELWPNWIRSAHERGVPVAVVNGRLGERSFRGYRRVLRWVRPTLERLSLVAAQDEIYAQRFRELGTPEVAVVVTGSLKFDGADTDRRNERTMTLVTAAGIQDDDIVFLAGSTQEPEEQLALDAFLTVRETFPQLRLILVPRHPERFDDVARMLDRSGVAWQRRSSLGGLGTAAARVLLVDTIGELGAWWGRADIGFVGGSMGSRGGQNMIEPAAYGVATSFGPNTWNFQDIVRLLLDADAARVVQDGTALTQFVRQCLENPTDAQQLGWRARKLVASQLGATDRTMIGLRRLLDRQARSAVDTAAAAQQSKPAV
ncbi:MAG: 3-deoxy-D-manno-octulosonic acid transferase [Pirellulaceae bacterium]